MSAMKNMTLKELLERKADDYGYGTLTKMSRASLQVVSMNCQ